MKRPILLTAMVTLMSFTATQATDDVGPELISVPVGVAYIPQGFDSNDGALMMTEGYFPNSCYQVGPRHVWVDDANKRVYVEQKAYYMRGRPCLMVVIPYFQTVEVGLLPPGDYEVVDVTSQTAIGNLPIRDALNEGPDDYLYATIRDAWVTPTDFDAIITLQGELPADCFEIVEYRVNVENHNVVSVLPIMAQRPGMECTSGPVPFIVDVTAPKLHVGRYLLHVRSIEGGSVNKLFDVWD